MKNIIQNLIDDYREGRWVPKAADSVQKDMFTRDVDLWGGADLIVTDRIPTDGFGRPIMGRDSDVTVLTRYAVEVSSLVFELRDRLTGYLDSLSKYSFYPVIGEAGKIAATKEDKPDIIIEAMLSEALKIAEQWDLHLYFAYGSNMDEDQMKHRCPEALKIEKVKLLGYRFAIDGAGYATVIPSEKDVVEGILWKVNSKDLASLDKYDGVSSNCYRREMVKLDDGCAVIAYISNRPECVTNRLGTPYMKRVATAAERQGLSPEYTAKLKAYLN